MAHLRAHDVALLIVGAPDDTAADLACVAADAGVADRVRLLGTRVDAELRVLYATAAVFCTSTSTVNRLLSRQKVERRISKACRPMPCRRRLRTTKSCRR